MALTPGMADRLEQLQKLEEFMQASGRVVVYHKIDSAVSQVMNYVEWLESRIDALKNSLDIKDSQLARARKERDEANQQISNLKASEAQEIAELRKRMKSLEKDLTATLAAKDAMEQKLKDDDKTPFAYVENGLVMNTFNMVERLRVFMAEHKDRMQTYGEMKGAELEGKIRGYIIWLEGMLLASKAEPIPGATYELKVTTGMPQDIAAIFRALKS